MFLALLPTVQELSWHQTLQTVASRYTHVMKAYRWSREYTLISALDERQWLPSCPGCFKQGIETYYPLKRAGLVDLERRKILSLLGLELVVWSDGWLVGALVDWLVGGLGVGWLVGWLVGHLASGLFDGLGWVGWLVHWFVGGLVG